MNSTSQPRSISVSAAPYDGYAFPRMLDSLAACGATHVEPAWIVGYTEPFDETAFTADKARQHAVWLRESGIECHAFSSHIDLGRPDALEVFTGRMDFAAALGAKVINTNAAARVNEKRFFENIGPLARHAESLGMVIGLENPGDGSDNLINTAEDGLRLIETIGHASVGLNYDAGNTVSHRPGVDPVADALLAMPRCLHTHIKDVRSTSDGWFFTPLGEGDIDCARILGVLSQIDLNVSIEIPLRLHRGPDARPSRLPYRVPLADIETVIRNALRYVASHLDHATAVAVSPR
jgi:sugar phosphate isomerase/epimerase